MNSQQRFGVGMMVFAILGMALYIGAVSYSIHTKAAPELPFVLMSVEGGRVAMQEFSTKLNCQYAAGFVNGVREHAIVECVPK